MIGLSLEPPVSGKDKRSCQFCGAARTVLVGTDPTWICKECTKMANTVFARKDNLGDMTYVDKT